MTSSNHDDKPQEATDEQETVARIHDDEVAASKLTTSKLYQQLQAKKAEFEALKEAGPDIVPFDEKSYSKCDAFVMQKMNLLNMQMRVSESKMKAGMLSGMTPDRSPLLTDGEKAFIRAAEEHFARNKIFTITDFHKKLQAVLQSPLTSAEVKPGLSAAAMSPEEQKQCFKALMESGGFKNDEDCVTFIKRYLDAHEEFEKTLASREKKGETNLPPKRLGETEKKRLKSMLSAISEIHNRLDQNADIAKTIARQVHEEIRTDAGIARRGEILATQQVKSALSAVAAKFDETSKSLAKAKVEDDAARDRKKTIAKTAGKALMIAAATVALGPIGAQVSQYGLNALNALADKAAQAMGDVAVYAGTMIVALVQGNSSSVQDAATAKAQDSAAVKRLRNRFQKREKKAAQTEIKSTEALAKQLETIVKDFYESIYSPAQIEALALAAVEETKKQCRAGAEGEGPIIYHMSEEERIAAIKHAIAKGIQIKIEEFDKEVEKFCKRLLSDGKVVTFASSISEAIALAGECKVGAIMVEKQTEFESDPAKAFIKHFDALLKENKGAGGGEALVKFMKGTDWYKDLNKDTHGKVDEEKNIMKTRFGFTEGSSKELASQRELTELSAYVVYHCIKHHCDTVIPGLMSPSAAAKALLDIAQIAANVPQLQSRLDHQNWDWRDMTNPNRMVDLFNSQPGFVSIAKDPEVVTELKKLTLSEALDRRLNNVAAMQLLNLEAVKGKDFCVALAVMGVIKEVASTQTVPAPTPEISKIPKEELQELLLFQAMLNGKFISDTHGSSSVLKSELDHLIAAMNAAAKEAKSMLPAGATKGSALFAQGKTKPVDEGQQEKLFKKAVKDLFAGSSLLSSHDPAVQEQKAAFFDKIVAERFVALKAAPVTRPTGPDAAP